MKYIFLILFFSITYLAEAQYYEEGIEFKFEFKIGKAHIWRIPNKYFKYLGRTDSDYKFYIDSLQFKYSEIDSKVKRYLKDKYEERKIILNEITAPYVKRIIDTMELKRKIIYDSLDTVIKETEYALENGILTLSLPKLQYPIQMNINSVYFLDYKEDLMMDCSNSNYQLVISSLNEYYFAGFSVITYTDIFLPEDFPIKVAFSKYINYNIRRDECFTNTNVVYKYSYNNQAIFLNQGESKILGEWYIYQGIANHRELIPEKQNCMKCKNELSFMIVRK